jgi:hypothetical protein
MSETRKKELHLLIENSHVSDYFILLQNAVNFGLLEKGTQTNGNSNVVKNGSVMLDRVALFAHMRTDSALSKQWIALFSFLENTNTKPAMMSEGVSVCEERLYSEIISVANGLKYSYSNTFKRPKFTDVELKEMDDNKTIDVHINNEMFTAISNIDPSRGEFSTWKELKKMNTFMINKHDTMLLNLDASGQNAQFYRRRERCFASFTAPPGMPRDLGLFYCFLVFENKNV